MSRFKSNSHDDELSEVEKNLYFWVHDAEDQLASFERFLVAFPGAIEGSFEDWWSRIKRTHWHRHHKHHHHEHPYPDLDLDPGPRTYDDFHADGIDAEAED
jgi:hypothetical protein